MIVVIVIERMNHQRVIEMETMMKMMALIHLLLLLLLVMIVVVQIAFVVNEMVE